MAAYDLEEQEQLAELKTWWHQHGNRVTNIALIVALALAGWQGWNWWQRNQATQASAVYMGLEKAAAGKDALHARELAGELIDKYPRTAYAAMGALLSARVQTDAGDGKNAQAQLQWAADHSTDPALRDLARLRLAAVLLDAKSYDAALKALDGTPADAFAPRFEEMKGDIEAARGKVAEARADYESAIAKLEKLPADKGESGAVREPYHQVLQSKLEAMGAGK
ncbi:MAG: tetratricopeptide repeat protein [Proteobacteria bacterium]|nr:tetratricopeptide repeat protein [Pseudomonadota bacterium]HQR04534.1 tetratricopeptide repeat protein [Rhodocyclaceae bacterium]